MNLGNPLPSQKCCWQREIQDLYLKTIISELKLIEGHFSCFECQKYGFLGISIYQGKQFFELIFIWNDLAPELISETVLDVSSNRQSLGTFACWLERKDLRRMIQLQVFSPCFLCSSHGNAWWLLFPSEENLNSLYLYQVSRGFTQYVTLFWMKFLLETWNKLQNSYSNLKD